ncbi:uncharacterized protein PITG_09048 [Phytophthora infestans T30-4]|uniref:Uncharacterized protein n=1 Tax=Phytophthora infestans (strain T30-4) TaxID=403677 RepID=D0NDS9_PHYIT|nr:uncharacterized protein PITG_09048 [Phytophthora infestans T30-4]EEY56236.1 hypothetical protein PITG_09048 [Phytophthora infestans T30-4]|eukprot:XP_002903066.1 hypothetical protein PITG_09048 [Phytophthora infestans T30-4]
MPRKRALAEDQPARKQRLRRGQALNDDATKLSSTLDFNGVWRELKAAGWTSKLPSGLDDRYRDGSGVAAVADNAQDLVARSKRNNIGGVSLTRGMTPRDHARRADGAYSDRGKSTTSGRKEFQTRGDLRARRGLRGCEEQVAIQDGGVGVNDDGGGAEGVQSGASRNLNQAVTTMQYSVAELSAPGAGVGHRRAANHDGCGVVTCGVDVEARRGEGNGGVAVTEGSGGRGQIATPQRRQPGSADAVDIVSSQDGGSGSGGGRRDDP